MVRFFKSIFHNFLPVTRTHEEQSSSLLNKLKQEVSPTLIYLTLYYPVLYYSTEIIFDKLLRRP